MKWPFKKSIPAMQGKAASFLLGMGAGSSSLSNAGFEKLATEGYAENAAVNACVNKLANSIASIDRKLYQKTKDGKLNLIESHPLLDLLAKPNPLQSGDEFIRALIAYRMIAGNAYIRGNGINYQSNQGKPPTELTLLSPGKMRVEPGVSYFPAYFEYKPNNNDVYKFPVNQISGNSEILHIKTFNPLNQWSGLPPMLAASYGIDINNSGNRYNKKLLDNDARPCGALIVKGADGKPSTLTDDQYQRTKEMLDTAISGSSNAGKPLLLEGGLEWQQMSTNAKDMDFHLAKNSSATDIGLIFGVPPQLLGIPGSSTFANYEQANLSFWWETVLPLNDLLLDALNRWLVPLFGDDLVLKYDADTVDALEPIRKAKADRIKEANYMQIGEKRHAMGFDKLANEEINNSLLLDGRGILLGMDGKVVSLAAQTPAPATAPQPDAAKYKKMLTDAGYTEQRAERLTKLTYG